MPRGASACQRGLLILLKTQGTDALAWSRGVPADLPVLSKPQGRIFYARRYFLRAMLAPKHAREDQWEQWRIRKANITQDKVRIKQTQTSPAALNNLGARAQAPGTG